MNLYTANTYLNIMFILGSVLENLPYIVDFL